MGLQPGTTRRGVEILQRRSSRELSIVRIAREWWRLKRGINTYILDNPHEAREATTDWALVLQPISLWDRFSGGKVQIRVALTSDLSNWSWPNTGGFRFKSIYLVDLVVISKISDFLENQVHFGTFSLWRECFSCIQCLPNSTSRTWYLENLYFKDTSAGIPLTAVGATASLSGSTNNL